MDDNNIEVGTRVFVTRTSGEVWVATVRRLIPDAAVPLAQVAFREHGKTKVKTVPVHELQNVDCE